MFAFSSLISGGFSSADIKDSLSTLNLQIYAFNLLMQVAAWDVAKLQ